MEEQMDKGKGRKPPLGARLWLLPLLMVLTVAPASHGGDDYIYTRRTSYPSNLIRTVQIALYQQGLDPGLADGLLGPKTQAALIEFQRGESLPTTAQPDYDTVALLLERNRQAIGQLQEYLAAKGLYESIVDGELGPETQAALLKYERSVGLPPTGKFGGETRRRILAAIRAEGSSRSSQ